MNFQKDTSYINLCPHGSENILQKTHLILLAFRDRRLSLPKNDIGMILEVTLIYNIKFLVMPLEDL